jgi:hypothetical protein
MSDFKISRTWLSKKGASELDVTMAKLLFTVGGKNVSQFISGRDRSDHLEIPAYFVAEWIAENWWPLLWEPRKSEDGEVDRAFVQRHSLLAAQHGFALPQIVFMPTGTRIHITARAREATFADVRFSEGSDANLPRDDVETELGAFVGAVCARLVAGGIAGTGLQDAWETVRSVGVEERQFCQFAGALGLDPCDVGDKTAALLESLLSKLGPELLMDLCLVAPSNAFEIVARAADVAFDGLRTTQTVSLEPLMAFPVPADNLAVPAWRRGVNAAKQLRKRMGITDTDPSGSFRVLDRFNVSTRRHGEIPISGEANLTGAVARDQSEARIALLQPDETQRRFAAARAIFAAWTSGGNEKRFLTSAVTRDQQANRAFAAELTAPYSLLRSRAKYSSLTEDQVWDLAAELEIGPDVIAKQALNNGLQIRPAA